MNENSKEVEEETSDTGTEQEIIIKLQPDKIVQDAGHNLFIQEMSTNHPKVLLQYDQQYNLFTLEEIRITQNTQITVVGLGAEKKKKATVGGKTSEELAKVIQKLQKPNFPDNCPSDLQKVDNISIVACDVRVEDRGQRFRENFRGDLETAGLLKSLSAHTTLVTVLKDGTKMTADFDNNPYNTYDILIQGIENCMKEMFNFKNTIKAVQTESIKVYFKDKGKTKNKKIKVQTVKGINSLKKNIKYIIQKSGKKRKKLIDKNKKSLGGNENMTVKEQWKDILQDENADTIAAAMREKVLYYRVQDFIYSIDLEDFYVNFYGTTVEGKLDGCCRFLQTIGNNVTYDRMGEMKNKASFLLTVKHWVNNNREDEIPINPLDGMAVLAIHISEVVRNPTMFIINLLLWDIQSASSWEAFVKYHPMTSGGTWSEDHAAIGLDFESDKPSEVRKKTIDVIIMYLEQEFPDIYNNKKRTAEEFKRQFKKDYEKILKGVLKKNFERQKVFNLLCHK